MKHVITSPKAPAAVGPYSQAVELNGTIFVSGQLPIDPTRGEIPESVESQTIMSLNNIKVILEEAGLGMDDIVKTTVLLTDIGDFAEMNKAYARFFPDSKPARVCYQVSALPKGAKVEIDAVAGK